ncbi:MAG: hypothetical protein FWC41_11490, partial [Firmicutes bacterium]|nr:hypothetical protein [Bacillota bacterium]
SGEYRILRDFFSKQGKKRRNTCCISSIFKDVFWKKIQKVIFSVMRTCSKWHKDIKYVTKGLLLC